MATGARSFVGWLKLRQSINRGFVLVICSRMEVSRGKGHASLENGNP